MLAESDVFYGLVLYILVEIALCVTYIGTMAKQLNENESTQALLSFTVKKIYFVLAKEFLNKQTNKQERKTKRNLDRARTVRQRV